jgi:hypothetical protein
MLPGYANSLIDPKCNGLSQIGAASKQHPSLHFSMTEIPLVLNHLDAAIRREEAAHLEPNLPGNGVDLGVGNERVCL